jgi:hypothetical protein
VGLQRYRLGTAGPLNSLKVRANLYDDVPARPASHEIALDGYDLGVLVPLPFLSGTRVQASRTWQLAVNGKTVTTGDRISLVLNPLLALEIKNREYAEPAAGARVIHPAALARQARRISLTRECISRRM